MMKHRSVAFEVKSTDDKTGEFAGYGSVFDVKDQHRDIVVAGAFAASLKDWEEKKKLPKMLWQHRQDQPIGVWTKMAEDSHGLYAEGRILVDAGETERRAYAHLKAGSVDGLSIGYAIRKGGIKYDEKQEATLLTALDLFELSVVTFPANEDALIEQVSSALGSPKDFERILRDAGLSRTQAKALMAGGYKALVDQRDADDEGLDSVVEALKQFNASLRAA